MKQWTPEVDKLRANPSAYYTTPGEVVNDERLTTADKSSILESWAFECRRLQSSAGEGLDGGEEGRLREVALAQDALKQLARR